jgi:hypothetical protein
MMLRVPKVWRQWVAKYGHHSGFHKLMKENAKKRKRAARKASEK